MADLAPVAGAHDWRPIDTNNKNRALGLYIDGRWRGTVFENVHGVTWARLTEGVGCVEGADGLDSLEAAQVALLAAVSKLEAARG